MHHFQHDCIGKHSKFQIDADLLDSLAKVDFLVQETVMQYLLRLKHVGYKDKIANDLLFLVPEERFHDSGIKPA